MLPTSKPARRLVGLLVGLGLVAVGTLALLPARDSVTVATPALVLILPGLVAGFVGGRVAGVVTAITAGLVLDLVFIEPYSTLDVHVTDDLVALGAFATVAVSVATLVEVATDRRRAAEQRAAEVLALSSENTALEQVEDARRALLRSVSHDLRTPLATIRAITSDLRDGTVYDAQTRDELLDLVGDEAERLDRLVANLLSMSRVEAGALQPELQAVALDELVQDRAKRFGRVLRDVHLTINVTGDLPLVDADYTLVDQVLSNLIENAVRHTPTGGTIRIDARHTVPMVEVAVSDQGPGVPLDEREVVFEPFRRGDTSQSSGLGLAICKAVVEAHGGRIWVGAAADGPGARFAFTLPVHQPAGLEVGAAT